MFNRTFSFRGSFLPGFFLIVVYVAILTLISWFFSGKSIIGIDDANIYMVYMRNLANGHGFVFNIGGERVEGFSSLLWTLIGSTFYTFTDNPEKLFLCLNILILSVTLFIISKTLTKGKKFLFLILVGLVPGFIEWTVLSLMETGLWMFLLTVSCFQILRYNADSSKIRHYAIQNLLYVLLIICRPEAMLWVPTFIAMNLLKEWEVSGSRTIMIKSAVFSFILFILAVFLLIIWRLNYFGYPLPNTYYAKVSSEKIDNLKAGIYYLYTLFIEKPFILVVFLFAAGVIILKIKQKEFSSIASIFILWLALIVTFVNPLISGGDHFVLHRFIMPSVPLIVLLLIYIIPAHWFREKTIPILLIICIFYSNVFNVIHVARLRHHPLKMDIDLAKEGRLVSEKLNQLFRQEKKLPSQGVLTAGGQAYGYKGETIDLMGLNNVKMAHAEAKKDKNLYKSHASFNFNVFLQLQPDLFWYESSTFIAPGSIVQEPLKINPQSFNSWIYKHIHKNPQFKQHYGLYRIINKSQLNALQIFANRKFASSLDTNRYHVKELLYE
jgi:hypothetical protein